VRNIQKLCVSAIFTMGASAAFSQSGQMSMPHSITAGASFSIPTSGTGTGVLYITGPGQALRRDVQLGQPVAFTQGDLYCAGHYLATLVVGASTGTEEFDVIPASRPKTLSFLARPSRISIDLHDGISGAAYVFDAYDNLITQPLPVSFVLSGQYGAAQSRTITTRNGVAWTGMDSTSKLGKAKFVAQAGGISSTRVIDLVPGDPCGLTISARQNGAKLLVETSAVHDCKGNPIPDGTIVTFTEAINGVQSTADVPIKQGIARVELPAQSGATISAASGVVAGNAIHWGGR
jgi:hypothetical protein